MRNLVAQPTLGGPITTAWGANVYRHHLASDIERFARVLRSEGGSDYSASFNRQTARVIREAAVVLWRDDLRKAATDGAALFIDRPFEPSLVRFQPQLWVYEVDVGIKQERKILPEWYDIGAVLIAKNGNDVVAITIMQPTSDPYDFPQHVLESVKRGEVDYFAPLLVCTKINNGTVGNNYFDPSIAAQIEFMALEIVACESVQHSRQMRRAAERDNASLPDLRVITLRRKKSGNNPGHTQNVEWSCQWLVGGHWRNQWFPKTEEHRPVYIMPYVKGPDGKPFRENNADKIFVVAR